MKSRYLLGTQPQPVKTLASLPWRVRPKELAARKVKDPPRQPGKMRPTIVKIFIFYSGGAHCSRIMTWLLIFLRHPRTGTKQSGRACISISCILFSLSTGLGVFCIRMSSAQASYKWNIIYLRIYAHRQIIVNINLDIQVRARRKQPLRSNMHKFSFWETVRDFYIYTMRFVGTERVSFCGSDGN